MKLLRRFEVVVILLAITVDFVTSKLEGNPYKILGVSRSANSREIRKAYVKLAAKWHPDKNSDANAKDMFIQVTEAYELLSEPERKRNYDQHGIVENNINSGTKHPFNEYNNFEFDSFEEFFSFPSGGSFHFPFAEGNAFLHKHSVTSKTFDQKVLPGSAKIPQLILFYGDWCTGCARAAAAWRNVYEELSTIGMDVLCIHAEREKSVARKMGISTVPAVIFLIDGHPFHYRQSMISASRVVGFIREKFPLDLIELLTDETIDHFLKSWTDNRIRVVIFGSGSKIRLRYYLLSYEYRDRAAFGYVSTENSDALRKRFGVPKRMDSVLVFKETAVPVASLSMDEIPYKLLNDLVRNNRFLILPRLSSQEVMDTLCPSESSAYRRRLCIILMIKNPASIEELSYAEALRQYAANFNLSDKVKFAYIFKEKQKDFVASLSSVGSKENANLVFIWRRNAKDMAFEWLKGGWDGGNSSIRRLDTVINKLIAEPTALTHIVQIKELTDEHAHGLVTRILRKLSLSVDFIRSHITRDIIIQTASLLATVLFIVAGGFIMSYLVRLEEESILAKANAESEARRAQRQANNNNNRRSVPNAAPNRPQNTHSIESITKNPECRLHEMRGETYNGLVRLIKPGCRTVILLLDSETKGSLVGRFQRCVWPYRKNKSLQFGYMHVDRGGGLSWYRQLLLMSLSEPRSLNINPRNCVGTVLSLNGYRKYFCVFHATLPGGGVRRRTSGYRNGGFLGLDSDHSSDEASDVERGAARSLNAATNNVENNGVLFTSHLLDNLPNWLDRLFEGSTHRYHIRYWPDFPVK